MKITSKKSGGIQLEDVSFPIVIKIPDGEDLTVCPGDSGFKLTYGGRTYVTHNRGIIQAPNTFVNHIKINQESND